MVDRVYDVGTVTIGNGDTVAVFSDALLLSNAKQYDTLTVIGFGPVKIMGVSDDTHLEISEWPYADVTNADYVIVQDGIDSFTAPSIARAVVELVEDLDTDGFYIFVSSTDTEPNPKRGDEGQYARQPSTGKEWYKENGVWVYLGITAPLNFDAAPWSAATTYPNRTLVTRAGKLWLSLQGSNLNHAPESSPSWWSEVLSGGDSYDVIVFDTDRPASGELILKLVFTRTVSFYAGLSDSKAKAEIAATASSFYSYQKNGTQFATLTFGAASSTGVWVSASDTVFAAGDVLTVIAPATRDATLSGVAATLSGFRS